MRWTIELVVSILVGVIGFWNPAVASGPSPVMVKARIVNEISLSKKLGGVYDIAIDADDTLYVVTTEEGVRLHKLDRNNQVILTKTLGGLGLGMGSVFGMVVKDSGELCISTKRKGRKVYVLDGNADSVIQVIKSGSGKGFLPGYMAADSQNNLYVSNLSGRSIDIFDDQHSYVGKFYKKTAKDEMGDYPAASKIIFDPEGNLIIAESVSEAIYKYSPRGERLLEFGGKGQSLPGKFSRIGSMGIDRRGRIYVVDAGQAGVISVFNADDGSLLYMLADEGGKRLLETGTCQAMAIRESDGHIFLGNVMLGIIYEIEIVK